MKTSLSLLFVAALAAPTVQAANFSFQGTFATDDRIQLFFLTLASPAVITFDSLGYGGGTNSAGSVIPAGGFDSFFTWYAADGSQIGTNDDGGCGNVNSHNGACLDAFFQGTLTAGSYTLALTQSGNEPIGSLSDGFTEQGQGNFTANGNCAAFCDTLGNTDNGKWAVDIRNVTTASAAGATPEPVTFLMTGCGLAILALAARRRINRSEKSSETNL